MSDFYTNVGILRDEIIDMLYDDEDHTAYVIAGVLDRGLLEDIAEQAGQGLPDGVTAEDFAANLRALANAVSYPPDAPLTN